MKLLWKTYIFFAMPAILFFYFLLFGQIYLAIVLSKKFGESDEPEELTMFAKILIDLILFSYLLVWSLSFFYGNKLINTKYEIYMIILNLFLAICVLYLAISFVKSEGLDLIWIPIYISSITIILFLLLIINLTRKKPANQ